MMNEKILIIDDDIEILNMLKTILAKEAYGVYRAERGAEAIRIFQSHPVDLVITDQTMPVITGVELIKRLRSIRPDIPVILCTGYSEMVTKEKLKAMGFHQAPGNERRILMLLYSLDALNWFQAGCIAMSRDPLQSYHYAAPLIDGDDLLILSRTSSPNARHQHDSDLVTFHRVRDFRSLALDLHPAPTRPGTLRPRSRPGNRDGRGR